MSLYTRFFFFFNDTATTEIYTLSLHDALPILLGRRGRERPGRADVEDHDAWPGAELEPAAGVEVAQGRVAHEEERVPEHLHAGLKPVGGRHGVVVPGRPALLSKRALAVLRSEQKARL